MEKENKDYKAWQFSSYDNPYIPKTEIDTAKLEIGADVFAQEYMAVFTRFTGLVYKEFDVDKHVHYFDHDKNAYGDYYFGLDFAVRGYTASVASIIKPSGDIYILDNYKKDNETAQVHGKAMQEMLELYADFSKYTGYADPAGFAKTQQGFKENQQMTWSLADEYTEQGFPIVPANNEVAAGINYVRQLFLQDKIHIHPRCADLIDEIQQYQWKDQPLTQIGTHTQPEEVRKINDHIIDGLRYMLYSKPISPEELEPKRKTLFPVQFEMKLDIQDSDENKTGDQINSTPSYNCNIAQIWYF